jgi:signal transduction histidine kinase
MNSKSIIVSCLILVIATFTVFIVFNQRYALSKATLQIKDHAKIISSSLWTFEIQSPTVYLTLAAKLNDYEQVVVEDDKGEVFLAIRGSPAGEFGKFLLSVNLIPKYELQSGIVYEGREIGTITAIWRCKTIYLYLYILLCMTLLLAVIWLFLGLLDSKRTLEARVQERTHALEKENKDRRQAEEDLRASNKRFRKVMDSLDSLVYVVDMETYKLLFINKYGINIWGDIIGETCWKSFQEDQRGPCEFCTNKNLVDQNGNSVGVYTWEFQNTLNKQWYECRDQAIRWTDGRLARMEIATNITSRKQTEKELESYQEKLEALVKDRTKELEAAQEELLRKERLAVLGQLTATVSHELRNPLGVLRSSAFYLGRKLRATDEKINKHLFRIDEQVSICDGIVGDLLEFTRGLHSEKIKAELNPWLQQLVKNFSELSVFVVEQRLMPDVPPLSFDQEKLRRVMTNLLTNAHQAVIAKKQHSEMHNLAFQPQIRVSADFEDGHVVIQIEDNGIGMDAETKQHAFEPLFTTRARGTGLGLAIVEKIVTEHQGKVSLESNTREGTTVRLTLPI